LRVPSVITNLSEFDFQVAGGRRQEGERHCPSSGTKGRRTAGLGCCCSPRPGGVQDPGPSRRRQSRGRRIQGFPGQGQTGAAYPQAAGRMNQYEIRYQIEGQPLILTLNPSPKFQCIQPRLYNPAGSPRDGMLGSGGRGEVEATLSKYRGRSPKFGAKARALDERHGASSKIL
jgi:hypothetical protein